ncbi:hypothetical protein RTBOTA2_003266 [Rhodotorula toruloides]|nr:hypothetical protein RTBOTA2_003266 [Rhodotorula toruloides]
MRTRNFSTFPPASPPSSLPHPHPAIFFPPASPPLSRRTRAARPTGSSGTGPSRGVRILGAAWPFRWLRFISIRRGRLLRPLSNLTRSEGAGGTGAAFGRRAGEEIVDLFVQTSLSLHRASSPRPRSPSPRLSPSQPAQLVIPSTRHPHHESRT